MTTNITERGDVLDADMLRHILAGTTDDHVPAVNDNNENAVAAIAALVELAGPAIRVGSPSSAVRQGRAGIIRVENNRTQVERLRTLRNAEQVVTRTVATRIQELRVAMARTLSVITPGIQEALSGLTTHLQEAARLREDINDHMRTYLQNVLTDTVRLQDDTAMGGTCQELASMLALLSTTLPPAVDAGNVQVPPTIDAAQITIEEHGPHMQIMIGSSKLAKLVDNIDPPSARGETAQKKSNRGVPHLHSVLLCEKRGGGRPFIERLIEQALLTAEPQAAVPDNVRSIQLPARNTNVTPDVEPAGTDSTVFSGTTGDDEAADRPAPVV